MIEDRLQSLLKEFNGITSWEDKYKLIISMGKSVEAMPESYKIDANKVKGCQSQVWLFAELKDGKIQFYGDSDASIVKGLVSLLLRIYNDSTPADILATKPTFLEDIGLKQHLSMSRSNGLGAMIKQVSFYAFAFQSQINATK